MTSVSSTAHPAGTPASRHSQPKLTAHRPIIDPTERSMPPVTITGVSASASSPISTPSRIHSKKFPSEKKFCPVTLNSAISPAIRSARIISCLPLVIVRQAPSPAVRSSRPEERSSE